MHCIILSIIGKLSPEDLDERAMDALKEYNPDDAIAVLKQFCESSLEHVGNKSAFLCGMMKTYRQNKKQGAQASPARGPDPNKLSVSQGQKSYVSNIDKHKKRMKHFIGILEIHQWVLIFITLNVDHFAGNFGKNWIFAGRYNGTEKVRWTSSRWGWSEPTASWMWGNTYNELLARRTGWSIENHWLSCKIKSLMKNWWTVVIRLNLSLI